MFSCNDNNYRNEQQPGQPGSRAIKADSGSGIAAEPILSRADSLQILYYDDPDGDPVRYTRYYQFTDTRDTIVINTLLANLQQPVEKQDTVKECRSEGKIYVYDAKQQPVKTIYFSTRCDTCCYLYFIKSGAFYYCKLSEEFKDQLTKNKALSSKP